MIEIGHYRDCMIETANVLYGTRELPPAPPPEPREPWIPPLRFRFIGPYLIPLRFGPTVAQIKGAVTRHYEIENIDIVSHRRDVSRPRQVAMYLSKKLTRNSYAEIGRRFGGRDHTTVIHAVREIGRRRLENEKLDADIRALEGRLS